MNCPTCKPAPALEELSERDVPFLGCTTCFGLFVAEDDLAAYVAAASGAAPVGDAFRVLLSEAAAGTQSAGRRRCPRCEGALTRCGFGDAPFVILDRCSQHGLWLDKKELPKVLRASRARAAVLGTIPPLTEGELEDDVD